MNSSWQKKSNATNEERISLVTFLSQCHKNGRLNKGAIDAAMEYFPFKRSQIKVIWTYKWTLRPKRKGIRAENPCTVNKFLWQPFNICHYHSVATCAHCRKRRWFLYRPWVRWLKKDGWWRSLKEHLPTEGVNGPPVSEWQGCHICSCKWTRAILTHWII